MYPPRTPPHQHYHSNKNEKNNDLDKKFKKYSIPRKLTEDSEKINAVGIDLGTSRCCAAVPRKHGIETVALDYKGERLLPSYVAFDEDKEKCGQLVIDRMRYYPKSTVFDSKRIIGINYANAVIDENWPFKVINADGSIVIEVETQNGILRKTPKQIATVLLKYVKEKAEAFQGQKLTKAVITVPASFTEAQEKATRLAAILAGWDEIELLPEPIAAAFAYFINRPLPNNANILLFDLGGGTLDVCIFKIQNNQIEIISNSGDPQLGGRDFDNVLIDFYLKKLQSDYNITELGNKKYKLFFECQKIKETLSTVNESWLDVEEFDPTKTGLIRINQTEFQNLARGLLDKIQNILISALNKINFNSDQIDKVLFVGGGSRMPFIKNLLQKTFQKAEHCCEEHPDEVVAIGAAYYGCNVFSSKSAYTPLPVPKSFEELNKLQNSGIATDTRFTIMDDKIITCYSIPKNLKSYNIYINAVGIHFGASSFCAAVNRKNEIQTIPLDNTGERMLPSYISFDEETVKCGKTVVERLGIFAKYTVFDTRKLIGQNFDEKLIDPNWPFQIIRDNQKLKIKHLNYKNREVTHFPKEIVSMLLLHIKHKIIDFQAKCPTTVVITIPTAFKGSQKEATSAAAKLAGFDKIFLLPEPIAASFAYFIDRPLPNNSNILVFNLGNETLDVCVLKVINSKMHIISNNEVPNIGDKDFDKALFEYFKKELLHKFKIDIHNQEKKEYKLLMECQKIKQSLIVRNDDWLDAEDFDTKKEGWIQITRRDFKTTTLDIIEYMKELVFLTLAEAKLQNHQISKVLRIGRSTRMPAVKDMLKNIFPQAEHCVDEKEDEVIALGAAHYSYHLTLRKHNN